MFDSLALLWLIVGSPVVIVDHLLDQKFWNVSLETHRKKLMKQGAIVKDRRTKKRVRNESIHFHNGSQSSSNPG